jgi:hypothetical protein
MPLSVWLEKFEILTIGRINNNNNSLVIVIINAESYLFCWVVWNFLTKFRQIFFDKQSSKQSKEKYIFVFVFHSKIHDSFILLMIVD